jgi:hypothetical protein
VGGEPGGEAADERVGDDGGLLQAELLDERGEPALERVDFEAVDGCRLAEAGDVGDDDPVVLG